MSQPRPSTWIYVDSDDLLEAAHRLQAIALIAGPRGDETGATPGERLSAILRLVVAAGASIASAVGDRGSMTARHLLSEDEHAALGAMLTGGEAA